MKRYLVLFILTLPLLSYTQTKNDTTLVIFKPTKTVTLFDGAGQYDYIYCCGDNFLIIYGQGQDKKFGTKYNGKVLFNGKHYVCNLALIGLEQKDNAIISAWTDDWEDSRSKLAENTNQFLEKVKENNEKIEFLNRVIEVENAQKLGLVVTWSWSESGSSITSQDFNFKILNTTKKTVKYVYASVSIKNPVGDFIDRKTLTLIGPIESNDAGSYFFENVFFSRVVKSANISSIKIQYFDGTTKTFTGALLNKVIVSEESLTNWINYVEEKSNTKESNKD